MSKKKAGDPVQELALENKLLHAAVNLTVHGDYRFDLTSLFGLILGLLPMVRKCLGLPEPTPAQYAAKLHERIADGRKKPKRGQDAGEWKGPLLRQVIKTHTGVEQITDADASLLLDHAELLSVDELRRTIEKAQRSENAAAAMRQDWNGNDSGQR